MKRVPRVALQACLALSPPISAAMERAPTPFLNFQCFAGPWGIRLPPSGVRGFGRVYKESARKSYDDLTEIRMLDFGGLAVTMLVARSDPHDGLVERVEVTDARWRISSWLNVGDPVASVAKRLGREIPVTNSTGRLAGESDTVEFRVESERVTRVIYRCYVG